VAKLGDALERFKPGVAPLTSFRLANMTTDNQLDLAELEKITGSKLPWTLDEGVQQTALWAREHPLE
jgi:nucleoside-diphosphate-sugar epimerase